MKHVPSLQSQPALLARYCANSAAGAMRPAADADDVWKRFKKRDRPAYKQLVSQLAARQQGLCVYCEQRLVDEGGTPLKDRYQVEHVLPKSGAVGRVLDWTNLVLACWGTGSSGADKSCGAAKGNQALPTGCEPRTIPLLNCIVDVGTDGKLRVNATNCGHVGLKVQDVEHTIAILNLDIDRLRNPRQAAGDAVREALTDLLRRLSSNNASIVQMQAAYDDLVASRLLPNQAGVLKHFWSAERSGLGEHAETWISNNQGNFS